MRTGTSAPGAQVAGSHFLWAWGARPHVASLMPAVLFWPLSLGGHIVEGVLLTEEAEARGRILRQEALTADFISFRLPPPITLCVPTTQTESSP